MRIDSYFTPQQTAEPGRSRQNSLPNTSLGKVNTGLDQTQLSGAHAQVQELAAQASQLPEIREAKVQALREAVQGGHYRANPANIARGLISEMAVRHSA